MAFDIRTSWIRNGELTHILPDTLGTSDSEMGFLARRGIVKVTENAEGTEFKWVLFSANWSSLLFLEESIHLFTAPYKFSYFVSGWSSEVIDNPQNARTRLSQLLAKSDVHISQHTIVKKIDPSKTIVPHVLRNSISDMTVIPELSVDCVFDEDTHQFHVQRVGSQSGIAKIYGMSPVSNPCLTGNSYDEVVSAAYPMVMNDDKPHYDHVLAAMNLPDKSVSWVPYQRVILPHRFPDGRKGVSVITEQVGVDIKIV